MNTIMNGISEKQVIKRWDNFVADDGTRRTSFCQQQQRAQCLTPVAIENVDEFIIRCCLKII